MSPGRLSATALILFTVVLGSGCDNSAPPAPSPSPPSVAHVQVHGTVTDSAGKPIPGCTVTVNSLTSGVSVPDLAAVTQADGTFQWRLQSAARYTFVATCEHDGKTRQAQVKNIQVTHQTGDQPLRIVIPT